jgi:hypothetical protein
MGTLSRHESGAPRKLTTPPLDTAEQITRGNSLTLAKIAQRLQEQHPDAPSYSLDRLSVGLPARALVVQAQPAVAQKNEINSGLTPCERI